MKAFLFSDLHADSRNKSMILSYLANSKEISFVIFAGDLVNMGYPLSFAADFLESIKNLKLPFLWVPGNNDFGASYELMQKEFPSLEGRIVEYFGQKYTGVGGSPASWSGQYEGQNSVGFREVADSIFVSHVPPPGLFNYVLDEDKLIPNKTKNLTFAPKIHICGHIHYRMGAAYLGSTKVVKLAPAFQGYYGIMDLETLKVEFKKF